jgi:hypothetical protein
MRTSVCCTKEGKPGYITTNETSGLGKYVSGNLRLVMGVIEITYISDEFRLGQIVTKGSYQ